MTVAEYPSHTGKTHVAVFNKNTGKFTAGKFDSETSPPETYTLKADGESGSALFFALMPMAIADNDFFNAYDTADAKTTDNSERVLTPGEEQMIPTCIASLLYINKQDFQIIF